MEITTTKLIIAVVVVIFGSAIFSIKKSKKKSIKQSDITISGSNNKFVGGDDNSESK